MLRLFRAMRRWENRLQFTTSYSLAYTFFGIVLPVAVVLFLAHQFEKFYFRLSTDIFFSILIGACAVSFFVLWKADK